MITTRVIGPRGHVLWEGDLPIVNKGQWLTFMDDSYTVTSAQIKLGAPGDLAKQHVILTRGYNG